MPSTQAKQEEDMYRPFVDMSTTALKYLRDLAVDGMREVASEVDIAFKVSDKTAITQNHGRRVSTRKPDVIIIPSRRDLDGCKEDTTKASMTEKADGEQETNQGKVCWQDVLSIVEFKRSGEMGTASPPTEGSSVPASGQQTLLPPIQSKSDEMRCRMS